jgi:hypothetical protein
VFDCPESFAEPRPMRGRYVREVYLDSVPVGEPAQQRYKPPKPVRMNYRTQAWADRRHERAEIDEFLCVFCGMPSLITHHVTYRQPNREDVQAHLRSVCRRCHDAISMLESERDMGLDRIDPLDPDWRDIILAKRAEIDRRRASRRDPERERR